MHKNLDLWYKIEMAIFRAILFFTILVIYIYTCHQLIRFADLDWVWQLTIIGFLALLFILILSSFTIAFSDRSSQRAKWKDQLHNVALTAMGYINFLITFVALRDLLAFVDSFIQSHLVEGFYTAKATALLMGSPLLLMLFGHAVVRWGVQIKKVSVHFPDLPAPLENFRILHITDLHIGTTLPSEFVRKLVARILEAKPDMIVFTGDILDGVVAKHQNDLKMLKHLKAPHGVYFVPGNHEYYWEASASIQAFRDLGFQVLLNEAQNVSNLSSPMQIAGVPDPAAKYFQQQGPDFNLVQSQLNPDSFKILLSHQPSLALKAAPLGFHLQLSGHTHGGQFFPWNWLIVFFQRYSKGLYRIKDMQLYVNQGTGYWGPQMRLGTYCELAEIILRKAPKKG